MGRTLPPEPTKEDIRRHCFASYNSLRIGIAIIAVIFPVALLVSGYINDVANPGSMSAYYWAGPPASNMPLHLMGSLFDLPVHAPPGRLWFVVGLFSIATFLYLYKGFSVGENIALNLAAVFAVLVACYPMEINCTGLDKPEFNDKFSYCFRGLNPHGVSAGGLFVCLFYVVFLRAMDTLPALGDPRLEKKFRRAYWVTGGLMIGGMGIALAMHAVAQDYSTKTFSLETAGVLAFAAYWIVKSIEMRYSQIE